MAQSIERACQNASCGADISHRGVLARFCSGACYEALRTEAARVARNAARPERDCSHCGDSIPRERSAQAIYCSPICKRRAVRRAFRARHKKPPQPRKPREAAPKPPKPIPPDRPCIDPLCDGMVPGTSRRHRKYCTTLCQQRAAGRKWRSVPENREKHYERIREATKANPLPHRASEGKRRARKQQTALLHVSGEMVKAKAAYWGDKCWLCGGPFDHIDHVKPLAAGGPHILANLRPACKSCNFRKGTSWFGPRGLSRINQRIRVLSQGGD